MTPAPAEIEAAADRCLAPGAEFFAELEAARNRLPPADYAALCLLLEERMEALPGQFDLSSRIDILAEAQSAAPDRRALMLRAAARLIHCRRPHLALGALLADALDPSGPLDFAARLQLERLLAAAAPPVEEHGHALLADALAVGHVPEPGRTRQVIEIGTTRERVPGQGSTMVLARLCHALGLDFVTVDMDPRNAALAQRQMAAAGLPFRAVTAKGEDYLADHPGPIDHVFLDAYDFDHGNHSGLRQDRYRLMLGSPINEEACHRMHLDCAVSLVGKMAPDGLICFDDTWQDEDGAWTAKGRLAMPYLLEHGFAVVATSPHAALLQRPIAALG